MDLLTALTWFSSLSFMYFGMGCFYSKFIISEFKRYALTKFRKFTGFLQVLGALGLVYGLYFVPIVLVIAATGLSLLMLAGFTVRIKIKDNFIKSSPAFAYAVINLCIVLKAYFKYF